MTNVKDPLGFWCKKKGPATLAEGICIDCEIAEPTAAGGETTVDVTINEEFCEGLGMVDGNTFREGNGGGSALVPSTKAMERCNWVVEGALQLGGDGSGWVWLPPPQQDNPEWSLKGGS